MILYIGEPQDEAFVNEIAKGVTDEIRMITNVHSTAQLTETVQAIPAAYIVINILCIRENPDTLIKQLKYIQTQINYNLIIVASGLMTDDPMIQSLYFAGIKNVIITSWFPNIASQCIKYLSGTYQKTELLQEESNETTRLDLKQIYQDDPIILKQLEELEEERQRQKQQAEEPFIQEQQVQPQQAGPTVSDEPYRNGKIPEENQTVKLTPEELFQHEPELVSQVREYEREQFGGQSTTLYQEDTLAEETPSNASIPYQEPSFQQEMNQYPPNGYNTPNRHEPNMQGMPEQMYQNVFYNNSNVQGVSVPPSQFSSPPPISNTPKQKKNKKVKKPMLITACLCIILLISIMVPVVCTIMNKQKQSTKGEELLADRNQYGAGIDATDEPTATPEQIVVGAIPDEEEPEETSVAVEETPTESPDASQENAAVTLTPIKEEETPPPLVTKKPVKTEKPTKKPEETKKPKETKAPEPTKQPKSTSTPKPTNSPKPKEIKIKSISLPDKVYVVKGGTYEIDMSYSPSNATETVSWSSSNSKIASISNGKLRAKKTGTVTITVRSKSGKKKRCQVVVSEE